MKKPFSIKALAVLCLLMGFSLMLPVVMVLAVIRQPQGGQFLTQIGSVFHLGPAELKFAGELLIAQASLFVLMGVGLLFRWKLAWFLVTGFAVDCSVVPFFMLDYNLGFLAVFAQVLTVINSICCLLLLRHLLKKEVMEGFSLSPLYCIGTFFPLLASLVFNLPFFYLGKFLRIG